MTEQNYRLITFDTEQPLPTAYQQWLFQNQPHAVFNTYEWFSALSRFKQLHEPEQSSHYYWLFILEQETLLVAAPLEQQGHKFRLITNFYTPEIELFYDRQRLSSPQAWQLLLNQLSIADKKWRSVDISPLYPEQLQQLQSLPLQQSVSVFPYHYSVNFQTRFSLFSDYWAKRSGKLRNTLKRRSKAIQNQAPELSIHKELTPQLLQHYWQIYERSWKTPEPSHQFIDWLMQWAAKQQGLRLGFLSLNGHPVACQLWLLKQQTAYIYKLAQDKAFDHYSPGTILTEFMFRTLHEQDGIEHVDFLLGDDEFKALWMDTRTPVMGAEIINRHSLSGQLLMFLYRLRNLVKRFTGFSFVRTPDKKKCGTNQTPDNEITYEQ